jgi:tetratricopeptide (TPR) repeat protein
MKIESCTTDSAGNFEISGTVAPGQYILVIASATQIKGESVRLGEPGVLSLALPAEPGGAPLRASRYVVSAGRLSIPATAWKHLAVAQRKFSNLKFDEAQGEIENALRTAPAFARAFSMRAFIRLAKKDFEGAAEDAGRAVLLDPGDAESFVALAMSANSLREFPRAEEAASRALGLRPDSWQGRLELAKSFYGQGKFVLALYELDSGNIDFPDAHLVRGNVLMRLDRGREAAEEFNTFLRGAPNDSRAGQIRHVVEALLRMGTGAAAASGH